MHINKYSKLLCVCVRWREMGKGYPGYMKLPKLGFVTWQTWKDANLHFGVSLEESHSNSEMVVGSICLN